MALKNYWGPGLKLMVDGYYAVVVLSIGQGRFDSVMDSLDNALRGSCRGHALNPDQLAWLKEQKV